MFLTTRFSAYSSALAFLASLTLPAQAADVPSIQEFYSSSLELRKVEHNFYKIDQKETAYWLHTSIFTPPIKALSIFEDDRCYSSFTHADGSGSAKFECASGATITANFNCRSAAGCIMRGTHSEKGNVVIRLRSNVNLSVDELLAYNQQSTSNQSVDTAASTKPTPAPAPAPTQSTASTETVAAVTSSNAATSTAAAPAMPTTTSSTAVVIDQSQTTVSAGVTSNKWQNAQTPEQAQAFANEIQASIVMYMAIYGVIEQQPPTLKDRVLSVVDAEITRLRAEKALLEKQLSQRFSTPIRPTNANLTVSAFRAADSFPKIPFYVPGTNEIGEMLVIPRVTDDGFLEYQFDFLDPTATYDKVRDSLSIPHGNVDDMILGLQKVDEWTKVAQDNNVNRRIEKTSACIPVDACETKKQGISSSEIIFQVYEDGSTAGRIQRNKGLFSVGYNMSVESSILLSAYLTYMRDVGAKEFKIGIMTDEEVEKIFN